MSEEMGCTVIFGGRVKRADIQRICEAMLESGDLLEAAELKRSCCTCGATNYGQAPDLVGLLRELGLPYRRYSEAKYEHDGEGEYWDGKRVDAQGCADPLTFGCRQDGSPYLVLGDLIAIRAAGCDLAITIERLRAIPEKLPPIEIVED